MSKEKHTVNSDTKTDAECGRHGSFWRRAWLMYYDGFRNMTVGRTLWIVILIKLFLIFVILKWIFFPDFLNSRYDNDADKATAVRENLTKDKND